MMRIATYNVHSCVGVDGRCAPGRVAAVIAEMDPDVVCLQEIDVERVRTGRIDQAQEIARILAMQFHFNATIEEVTGKYGDAVLTKTSLKVVAAGALPEVPRPLPRERRGVIWVETCVGGETWQIINTHFGLGRGERRLQARALVEGWIGPALQRGSVLLGGDFNSRRSSAVHKMLGEPLHDVFRKSGTMHSCTFSTRWPFVCLDYLFASPDVHVERATCWKTALTALASDHFPIVAEVAVGKE